MEFIKLRLRRQRHGHHVPFSLLYLCRGPDIDKVKSIFETFLGFPIRHATKTRWNEIIVAELNGEVCNKKLGDLMPGLLTVEENWHAVIPIMSRTRGTVILPDPRFRTSAMDHRGELDLYKHSDPENERPEPAYLVSPEWRNWIAQGTPNPNPAFPPTTYFVTRDHTYVPPCAACPRLGYHEAGECHLGDPECYVHLGKYNASARMFQKLREYDQIQESLSAVPEDDARPDSGATCEPTLPPDPG